MLGFVRFKFFLLFFFHVLERCLLALGTKRHSFPRFLAVACLNALGTSCMFSGVFSIGYIYIHTLHQLHIFPHSALVAYLPRTWTSDILSHSWQSTLLEVAYPSVLSTFCIFSTRLEPQAYFPALANDYIFFCLWH